MPSACAGSQSNLAPSPSRLIEGGGRSSCVRRNPVGRSRTMPRGDKSGYTDKQKRQAEHIEDSERDGPSARTMPSASPGRPSTSGRRRQEIRLRPRQEAARVTRRESGSGAGCTGCRLPWPAAGGDGPRRAGGPESGNPLTGATPCAYPRPRLTSSALTVALLSACLPAAVALAQAAAPAGKTEPPASAAKARSMQEILDASQPSDWRTLDPREHASCRTRRGRRTRRHRTGARVRARARREYPRACPRTLSGTD